MGTSGGTGQSLYGGIQGEAKGMTCAQVKALFTCKFLGPVIHVVIIH